MMLDVLWGLLILCPILHGVIKGGASTMMQILLSSGSEAVKLIIEMTGGFMLWCGLIEILDRCKVTQWLGRMMRPLLLRLFPDIKENQTLAAITMNLTSNMLGAGNAATPLGLRAMELMAKENAGCERAGKGMCMFLVLNSCCVQLIPSTVLTLRAAAGSNVPGAVIVPTFISTLVSAVTGVLLCILMGRERRDE